MTELFQSKISQVLASIEKEGALDSGAVAGKDDIPGAEASYKARKDLARQSLIIASLPLFFSK